MISGHDALNFLAFSRQAGDRFERGIVTLSKLAQLMAPAPTHAARSRAVAQATTAQAMAPLVAAVET
jgi:hypothetical protein